jgi:hypothetical protein
MISHRIFQVDEKEEIARWTSNETKQGLDGVLKLIGSGEGSGRRNKRGWE